MENISSTAELQVAIQLLEAEQAVKLKLMKKQFHLAYESLKPVNLIESTLKDIASSPILVNNILVTSIGMLSGYLSQKAVTGKSSTINSESFLVMFYSMVLPTLLPKIPKQ